MEEGSDKQSSSQHPSELDVSQLKMEEGSDSDDQSNPQHPSKLDVSQLKRSIVSIEYPGRVNNLDEAYRTMGGLQMMSTVHSKENRKYIIFIHF